MTRRAVLLTNLGSPNVADLKSVRSYLNQFLMDPYVMQLPWIFRRLLVSLFILPIRSKVSVRAFQKIWLNGSPLIVLSRKLKVALQSELALPVGLSMRYGDPSIEAELLRFSRLKIIEIVFIPLYPHFSSSTVTTSIEEAKRIIKKYNLTIKLSIIQPFYDNNNYIRSLVSSAQPYLVEDYDHILFSYHGLPESHIRKLDISGSHCLRLQDCCQMVHECHSQCYRHQIFRTTQLFADKACLNSHKYSIAFQSHLGLSRWLDPNTEARLIELANSGVKNILVICPAFVIDCLETLEEIAIRGRKIFFQYGGKSLILIPCLNYDPKWVSTLALWCRNI
ncbi:MAG: ferrochelatase [Piscirickettsiaceae bacterium]|nr:ferrochelatase [Piscirickettsiaceae bacterium]